MEKNSKMKKQRTESPLQDLNGRRRRLPIKIIHKPNTKKHSNPSSYSPPAAVSGLKFSISSKTSSFSSFSKKPTLKSLSRFKEIEIPRKPISQKSKPTCKNGQRSKLPSVQGNTANKRSTMKTNSQVNGSNTSGERLLGTSNLNCAVESCSPVGKLLTNGFSLNSVNFGTSIDADFSLYEVDKDNSSTTNAVKTPPIEPSLSPEIQSHSHSKIPVLRKSALTPVCYGTGHLVSGVADNRKCRRRGSLNGGFEKINLLGDDSHDSPIPLPAEASVRWLLSPCDKDECDSAIDSITESLTRVDISPSRVDLTRFQENVDSVSSTLDDLWVSQMRISWRDADEFDCCCFLSDEEGVDRSDNGLRVGDDDDDVFPMVLDYEPCISARGKEKAFSLDRANACAESICTDGGGLVASNDSDLNFAL
ncbi:hypothetical protein PHJA_000858800 [Phtheirospermum japonicum]|uniref:Uncharacterized protein n=1 Tax=Phtheirospermum japonicum TaxID=374723 RepID=A0A830BYN9_9LAMI|nr:hypothetical protein PHJA_000858800 [Phtheirospermum japonicum]